MPIIFNSYSRPKPVEHMESDETESELSSSEDGSLEENDMDADTEYSYQEEDDNDRNIDFDVDSLSDDTECLEDEDGRPSSSSSTYSSASSFSTESSVLPESSAKSSSSQPSAECSRIYMVLHQLVTIFVIYLKFAVLAVLVYCVALWYALNFTDLDGELDAKSSTVSASADDIDTCPAALVA